jgi:hypothetical protein
MTGRDELRARLQSAMAEGGPGRPAADRLCVACVRLLHVDGAAISLMHAGTTQGTYGSSGRLSRRLDEFQFTFGEGPCFDAHAQGHPVLVPDLAHADEHRWPAFTAAVLDLGVAAVFALPATIATHRLGVLDLFRTDPRPLSADELAGCHVAADLAARPLFDLVTAAADGDDAPADGQRSRHLDALERVEVYQATGMVMSQLAVGPDEALLRIRAHAFAHDLTASEVAWAIVERRLRLDDDADGGHERAHPGTGGTP